MDNKVGELKIKNSVSFYSGKKKLEKLFEAWCKENKAQVCIYNFVVFLQMYHLLDMKEATNFVTREYPKLCSNN